MIRSLNLDSMFRPTAFQPEIEFSLIKFSGGELHIKLNKNINYTNVKKVVITHRVNNSDDLMAILIAENALRKLGIKHFDLIMPYIPYARQDRYDYNENFGESFTLEVFANIINSIGFEKIYCWDAHSDVSKAIIKNVHNIDNYEFVSQAIYNSRISTSSVKGTVIHTHNKLPVWLISPDSGADKKINSLHTKLFDDELVSIEGVVKCDKKREVSTGKLSGFEVPNIDLKGLDCFIVDDICDAGGTFLGLGNELLKHNPGKLYLAVTHGIFSKGFIDLSAMFERIYCTNSIKDFSTDTIVTQYQISI